MLIYRYFILTPTTSRSSKEFGRLCVPDELLDTLPPRLRLRLLGELELCLGQRLRRLGVVRCLAVAARHLAAGLFFKLFRDFKFVSRLIFRVVGFVDTSVFRCYTNSWIFGVHNSWRWRTLDCRGTVVAHTLIRKIWSAGRKSDEELKHLTK